MLQFPTHGVHMTVDVRPLGQHLKLHFHRGDFQVRDEGVNDIALLPGAPQKKIYRDDLDYFDIAVVTGIDDTVLDPLNGNVV